VRCVTQQRRMEVYITEIWQGVAEEGSFWRDAGPFHSRRTEAVVQHLPNMQTGGTEKLDNSQLKNRKITFLTVFDPFLHTPRNSHSYAQCRI
jgi:hypothetical protein